MPKHHTQGYLASIEDINDDLKESLEDFNYMWNLFFKNFFMDTSRTLMKKLNPDAELQMVDKAEVKARSFSSDLLKTVNRAIRILESASRELGSYAREHFRVLHTLKNKMNTDSQALVTEIFHLGSALERGRDDLAAKSLDEISHILGEIVGYIQKFIEIVDWFFAAEKDHMEDIFKKFE